MKLRKLADDGLVRPESHSEGNDYGGGPEQGTGQEPKGQGTTCDRGYDLSVSMGQHWDSRELLR